VDHHPESSGPQAFFIIAEIDTTSYNIAWWRRYWRGTRVQGVILNAGGIVAYYPGKFPLHHRAEGLVDRDLHGELAQAAQEDGLYVFGCHFSITASSLSWQSLVRRGSPV